MSFLNFPETRYVKTLDAGESARMGTFKDANDGELIYMRSEIIIHDVIITAERMRIKLFHSSDLGATPYATSEWSDLSLIPSPGSYWIGMVRFDFDGPSVNKNVTYYPVIEIDNYTPSTDSFIGVAYDFPLPRYSLNNQLFYDFPLTMEIFTKKLKDV